MRTALMRRGAALTVGVAASVVWVSAGPATADHSPAKHHSGGAFAARLLVADQASAGAPITDPNLVNPWGIAFGPTTPLWVANNGTSTSTLYSTNTGPTKVPLVVSTQPAPTGVAFNSTTGFNLPSGTHTNFLFDSLSGQISGWAPGSTATTTLVTIPGAAYTGLAVTDTKRGPQLYAADSASKLVQVFNGQFDLTGVLSDPRLPKELTPYNVAVLNHKVYVSYAPPPAA